MFYLNNFGEELTEKEKKYGIFCSANAEIKKAAKVKKLHIFSYQYLSTNICILERLLKSSQSD